ncbi:glycine cleavage system protein R [Sphingomonas arenae]|uniref:glycine cleavage system protein R n=1 Tax=Sphingomonas arenae TaxID=2812555 RepID=UPI001967BD18|nr:ACT domain-containing protein [Sphingomonas arenae]
MTAPAILTVIGPDRPGLTQEVAAAVMEVGGNWLESHLSSMAGMFVGAVHVELPGSMLTALEERLAALQTDRLKITVVPVSEVAGLPDAEQLLFLELVGQDRPGIVQEVTSALAGIRVNIATFESAVEDSSWSGAKLFRATAELLLPPEVSETQVREVLEGLSGEIMVDLDAVEDGPIIPRPDPTPASTT